MHMKNIIKGFRFVKTYGLNVLISGIINIIRRRPLFYGADDNTLYIHSNLQNEPNEKELQIQREKIFKYNPLISIVILIHNTSLSHFKQLLESVQAQTYSNWELCIADGSPKKNNKIAKLCKNDKQIHYIHLDEDKGISGNTNDAIKLTTGDYIIFMSFDDVLTPFALYEIVNCINYNPSLDFIYPDSDSIINNRRCNPCYKPDFSPDYLRSTNYIGHFMVVSKGLVLRLNGFNGKYDGAQDYDFVLRMSEVTTKIHHIHKILVHNRQDDLSIAKSSSKYLETGRQALAEHIGRLGYSGTVEILNGIYNIVYDVIGNPSISIIIPNKDLLETLKKCVESIVEKSTYTNYEIVIVENNSENEETFTYYNDLEKQTNIRVLNYPEKEFNYSKIINYGVQNCSSDYIVQLNNDTEIITNNWMELMLGFAQRSDVGAVGAKLYYPDGDIQHAGVFFLTDRRRLCHVFSVDAIRNYISVTGACLMSRRELYESVDYMDEKYAFSYGDVDFCFKLRSMGLFIVFNPYVELFHYESKTRGYDDTPEKQALCRQEYQQFLDRWSDAIDYGEPYIRTEYLKDHYKGL